MKEKRPYQSTRVKEKKSRSIEPPRQRYPSWRFSTVDIGGPFAWPANTDAELKILQKLRAFDSMHWPTIEGKSHHAIDVDDLSKEAKKRLDEKGKDDVDTIFSFHLSGEERIIGVRNADVLELLWWDPQHKVCLSHKKHT